MSQISVKDGGNLFKNSALYQEFLAEREEILKHKWIESEKAGYDVGFEKALLDWIVNHRATWRSSRHKGTSSRNSPENMNIALAVSLVLASGGPLFH
jgi:hypothetical protein